MEYEVVVLKNGDILHFLDGKIHRDGNLPAVIRANGDKEYWFLGTKEIV